MTFTSQNRTSDSYRFTVKMVGGTPRYGDDFDSVQELRELVKNHNKKFNTTFYVKLQGRGHRQGVRRYNQSLPLSLATHADVYVYTR